jgi:chromosome segregation ATPase
MRRRPSSRKSSEKRCVSVCLYGCPFCLHTRFSSSPVSLSRCVCRWRRSIHSGLVQEYLTNTLQKRLDSVLKEKTQLERSLAHEQEIVVDKLRRELGAAKQHTKALHEDIERLKREKVDLECKLEQEQEFLLNRLRRKMENIDFASRCVN